MNPNNNNNNANHNSCDIACVILTIALIVMQMYMISSIYANNPMSAHIHAHLLDKLHFICECECIILDSSCMRETTRDMYFQAIAMSLVITIRNGTKKKNE